MWRTHPRYIVALATGLLAACATTESTEPALVPGALAGATLLRGGFVMTAAGPTLEGADVLIYAGKIHAVGVDLPIPASARIVNLEGRWVTPGLIDPHSHLGIYALPSVAAHADGNETSGPFQAALRAEDAFWPQDPAIERALAGGVTTIHVLPGSANLIGGQGVTLRLKPALSAREMRFEGAPTTMKMACGENPKRVYGQRDSAPTTRMAELAMLRAELEKARAYEAKSRTREEERNFGHEALACWPCRIQRASPPGSNTRGRERSCRMIRT